MPHVPLRAPRRNRWRAIRGPGPAREPALRPAPLPALSCTPCPAWTASLSHSPEAFFFLLFFFPSCLLMSDGLRSPGGISMAGGPAGASAAPRGRPAPLSLAQPPGPSLAGGRSCTTAAPSRSRRQPERAVSSSGNDGEGVTVAAVGQRV